MRIDISNPQHLATLLAAERKRQKLTREQAAAVCNVSPSFIRDAESQPERCTLGKLVQLIKGLGLTLEITSQAGSPPVGIIASAMHSQESERATDGLKAGSATRATDVFRQISGEGIINAARRDRK